MNQRKTTPFEDLILGSQFLPLLARLESKSDATKTVGVLQCRRCGATFLQEFEALSHYKLHVFESHKEHFHVVVGSDVCPASDCKYNKNDKPTNTLHFHCSYCKFTVAEILELPLHMEKSHLAFYKEVSLVLRGGDSQLTKVYECGECGKKVQGTVSIIQHLLVHDCQRASSPMQNGETSESTEEMKEKITPVPKLTNGKVKSSGSESKQNGFATAETYEDESSQEVNPLDLLTTVIEAESAANSSSAAAGSTSGFNFSVGSNSNDGVMGGLVVPNANEYFLMSLPAPTHFLDSTNESNNIREDIKIENQSDDSVPSTASFTFPTKKIEETSATTTEYTGMTDHPGVFQCDLCDKAFKYQYILMSHKKNVHEGVAPGKYKCGVCAVELTTRYELKRHLITAHSPTITPTNPETQNYNCIYCGMEFQDANALKNHTATHIQNQGVVSGGDKGVKCESCGIEFTSKSDLTHHVVKYQGTCNPDKTEGVKCATCGEDLENLEALKEHRKSSHPTAEAINTGGRRGFQCDYCGKTFNCRSNLRDHLVVHTGEKPYPCEICGKTFSFIHNMKTHRLTHNEGRNETCPYCDKAYKSKISLYYHMKKGNCRGLSTKQVPEGFERCSDCLQMYSSGEKFQAHKDRGLCHMSYRCEHCGIRCSSQEKLQRHLQKKICFKTTEEKAKKRHKKHKSYERSDAQPELVCERCNYTKDCCCTFSCPFCHKRIFSVLAFTIHRTRTCPALKLRKEKLRAVMQEKAKLAEKKKQNLICIKQEVEGNEKNGNENTAEEDDKSLTSEESYSKETQPKPIPAKFTAHGLLGVPILTDKTKNVMVKVITKNTKIALKEETLKLANELQIKTIKTEPKDLSLSNNLDETMDDDSNSGSLTDLSTFTSSNILQSVAESAE